MGTTFNEEIQQFIDVFTVAEPGAEGDLLESLTDRIHRGICELFDVVGKIVNLDDNPESLDSAKAEITAALSVVIAKVFIGKPGMRIIITTALPSIVSPLVEFISKYTGTAEEFINEHVLHRITKCEETLHRVRGSLAGT